jgi:glycosyltransferase involved in cell wall biosynthesis
VSDRALPLLDLHHLGHRQTGNESWARSLSAALFELDGPESYDIAITGAAPAEDLRRLPARSRIVLGSSSTRRLAWDLPRGMRRLHTSTVLVQYTAPLSRVPAVVAVHDMSFEDPRAGEWLPWRTRLRYRTTIRESVRRAAHVIAISEHTRSDLIERYDVSPERVSVVYAAVDPVLRALIESTPERRRARPTVLAVGNVVPRKNLVVVAEAVRRLRDRGEDVTLRIVGTVPPSGRDHERLMSALLGDALETTGHITSAQLATEYRSAHVLAFPSLFEGFGLPVIEAMAAGMPVVVADRTSLPEVAGDAALIVPADDVEAWARALSVGWAGGSRHDLTARGAARAARFTWRSSAADVSALLACL